MYNSDRFRLLRVDLANMSNYGKYFKLLETILFPCCNALLSITREILAMLH